MPELWYRFNVFAERQFFDNTNLIDGIIVPAHVMAYYEVSFPQFLKECGLPFIIDPVSYVWDIRQRLIKNENGELKKSYAKLVEKLNCKIGNLLGDYPLSNINFSDSDLEEFVHNVLKFQLFDVSSKKPDRLKSIQRLKERISIVEGTAQPINRTVEPYALIPPYFYFTEVGDKNYSTSLQAARYAEASKYAPNRRIFPCLCMERSILTDESQIHRIIDDFKDFQGVLFWINLLEETTASQEELNGLTTLVKGLSSKGAEVINLYGGYFSMALHHAGLSKMSCGICYSSARNVHSEASGGGLPVRYYEPSLKLKIMPDVALKLYLDKPKLFNCDCPICSKYSAQCQNVGNNQRGRILSGFFSDEGRRCVIDWETSRLHFLNHRKTEKKNIEKTDIDTTASDLLNTFNELSHQYFEPIQYGCTFESINYLRRWGRALRNAK
jgi:hypothetical protein